LIRLKYKTRAIGVKFGSVISNCELAIELTECYHTIQQQALLAKVATLLKNLTCQSQLLFISTLSLWRYTIFLRSTSA